MEQTTIAIISQKGGVGKSTLAACLAHEMNRLGLDVSLHDHDPQQTAALWASIEDVIPVGEDARIIIHDSPPRYQTRFQRQLMMETDLLLLPTGQSPSEFWALHNLVEEIQEAIKVRPELDVRTVLVRADSRTTMKREAMAALRDMPLDHLESVLCSRVAYPNSFAEGRTPGSGSDKADIEVRMLTKEVLDILDLKS